MLNYSYSYLERNPSAHTQTIIVMALSVVSNTLLHSINTHTIDSKSDEIQ